MLTHFISATIQAVSIVYFVVYSSQLCGTDLKFRLCSGAFEVYVRLKDVSSAEVPMGTAMPVLFTQ